ncbi:MAG TPA: type I-E CRISPR-associated protein Cas7/Cse4/CasC [Edaphocola sp.]|nr:type I-E CRISPR-associated protein Cas7/Cse4/CasC [Edaphocola sp.]
MSDFIQLHILTAYPPSNPNRDDLGRPKTARMGGVDRLRISSQSLKRAWRTSEIFEDALSEYIGKRTKLIGVETYKSLIEKGVSEKNALEWATQIASKFGKNKAEDKKNPKNKLEIEQLVHIGPSEQKAIDDLINVLVSEDRAPEENELDFLRKDIEAVDIAMFGRMLASSPKFNIEAAVQVSHALTVNQVVVEDDYFTAVDDLNDGQEDAGSSHIGETSFGSGVFYVYICINKSLLVKNLSGNEELANKAISSLVEASLQVAPSGKQNSYASRVRASFAMAEKGPQQPRSLAVSFLEPVKNSDQVTEAISRLKTQKENMDKVYGSCSDSEYEIDAKNGNGTVAELLKFLVS